MKVKIVKANTSIEGSNGIIELMLANNKPDSQHYIIVPDRFTLSVEQEICEKNESDGFYNVDVVSFTRLAMKLLNTKIDSSLSKEGTVILLNKIIRNNNDKLLYYKDISSYSFSKEMFAAIASLRDSNLFPEDILEKIQTLDGVTKEKLHDIALCYNEYVNEIKGKYIDTISRIDKLISKLPEILNIGNMDFYFFGFNIYSAKQLELIKSLTKYAKSVNIAFAYDKWASNHNIYITHQLDEIIEFCNVNQIECQEIERSKVLPSNFQLIHQNMFGYINKELSFSKESSEGQIILYAERNPYEEIKAVSREIHYLVKNKNYRYKDIAIVIADDNYKRIIEEIFTRVGIPYFVDTKYYIKDSIPLKFVNSYLRAVERSFTLFDMLKLSHHPFWNFSDEELSKFENYVVKFNTNHKYFANKFTFDDYAIAESVRKKLMSKLDKLDSKPNSIAYFCDFVVNIFNDPYIDNQLKAYLESDDARLIASGDISDFIKVLEEIKAINGTQTVSLSEFISIFNSAIADMGKGVLPRSIDSVFVGSTTESRYSSVCAMFVIGASSGQFPVSSGDNVIFSAFDNEYMKRNELPIYPTPIDNNNMERMVVVDLISKPKNYLYVGYAVSSISGEQMLASEGLNELMSLTNCKKLTKIIEKHNFDDNKYLEYILINKQNAYFEYKSCNIPEKCIKKVEEYLICNNVYLPPKLKEDKQINYADYLFYKKDGKYQTSVSQLERYFSCPYSYFCQYGLGLNNKEDGTLQVYDIGNIIHNILEYYFKNYKDVLRTASDKEINNYIDISIKEIITDNQYYRFGTSGYGVYALDNIKKEVARCLVYLTDNVKNSNFNPTYFEQKFGFGDNDKKVEIVVNDKIFNFKGKIDRVDTYKDKILIIDYKTGHVDGSIEEIYNGSKIQLFLYLKPFLDEGKKPAGVCYLPIKSNYAKENSNYSMKGQVLDDFDTWAELDNNVADFEGTYESPIINFKLSKRKNGNISFTPQKNKLTTENFDIITRYVEKIVEIAISEIMEGFFEKKPYFDKCKYCSYINMCGNVQQRNKISAKKIEDFEGKQKIDE
ncbi:MAG: PD-(D/E)XK nuclease family protein [Clostridia bacterium]